jgi:hypothetical protein
MSVALEVEQAVAGFVNTSPNGRQFATEDVNVYIMSLWTAGCGPVRLNFTQPELHSFLDKCCDICLVKTATGYKVEKSKIDIERLTQREREALGRDEKRARSFVLFCDLRVDLKTPDRLLDAMGFRFMY